MVQMLFLSPNQQCQSTEGLTIPNFYTNQIKNGQAQFTFGVITDYTSPSSSTRRSKSAIGNRRAAAATGIENDVVTAGVVQTVHADRGALHHYAVAG